MQKVVGSSPIIRSQKALETGSFSLRDSQALGGVKGEVNPFPPDTTIPQKALQRAAFSG